MQDLKVTLVQPDVVWEDTRSNLAHYDQLLHEINNSDLVILPEMFNSGFTMNAAPMAEKMDGETVEWMRTKAREKRAIITGSLIINDGGKYFNRLVWMESDGTYQSYDKRHLFRMADENLHYSGGASRLIVSAGEWKICPQICYDLRFPVWSRNRGDYHLLFFIANWPEARSSAWNALLKARAIENLCYCIGVNRVGADGNGIKYSGGSAAYGPKGEEIIIIPDGESISTHTFSLAELLHFRKKFGAHLDADRFEIIP